MSLKCDSRRGHPGGCPSFWSPRCGGSLHLPSRTRGHRSSPSAHLKGHLSSTLMHQQCSIPGCRSVVIARYSPLCQKHRQRLRRFGDPSQQTIHPRALAPHLMLLSKRQSDNADSAAWAILRRRWSAIVEQAQAAVSSAQEGEAFQRHRLAASRLILGVAGVADADLVARTCMAVVFHERSDPRRYASDRGLLFTMVRMFLRLNPAGMGRYYCPKLKRTRSVRQDAPPKTVEVLAEQLNAAFGGAAAQLWVIEQNRVPPAERERRDLAAALQALKA